VKFYLDEDLSPGIAEMMRKLGTDGKSAHEVQMTGASDGEQLDFAAAEGRCLVTFNRNDFIMLTRLYLDANRPHCGVLIVPYTFKGNEFRHIAQALSRFASVNPDGLPPYAVAFLQNKPGL
jgi:predicted nuclease of predicted toxin-antitoxin system